MIEESKAERALQDEVVQLRAELVESRKCAEIMQQSAFAYQTELGAIKAQLSGISERIAKVWIGHAHIDDLITIGRELDAIAARKEA